MEYLLMNSNFKIHSKNFTLFEQNGRTLQEIIKLDDNLYQKIKNIFSIKKKYICLFKKSLIMIYIGLGFSISKSNVLGLKLTEVH